MLTTAATLTLMMTSCLDEQEDISLLPEGLYPLKINSVTLCTDDIRQPWGTPQTRVSESSDGDGSSWNLDDMICVQTDDSSSPAIYTIVAAGEIASADALEEPLYWKDHETHDIEAWYPVTDGILGLDDQTGSLAYLLHSTTSGNFLSLINLEFRHQLAKIRIVPADDVIEDVTSLCIHTYTICKYEKGIVTEGSDEGWIEMKKCTYGDMTCWEANVVPGREISRVLINGTEERSLSAAVTPEAGKLYAIDLKKDQGYILEDGIYKVYNADGLMAWANNDDKWSNCTLTADIDITGLDWAPVASHDSPYTGTFDGNGHTITGLRIDNDGEYAGMFAVLGEGGTVRNLTLDNAVINGTIYVGGIAGRRLGGTIEGCSVSGTITGTDIAVGGIIGDDHSSTTIIGCSVSGTVKGSKYYVGGIAGLSNAIFIDCHSYADIEGTYYVGGVVGHSGSKESGAIACHSTGDIKATGSTTNGACAGGIAGDSNGRFAACYSTGNISGEGSSVGGIAGYMIGESIISCYHAAGDVSGTGENIGGILGVSTGTTPAACYWNGAVSSGKGIGDRDAGSDSEVQKVDGDWSDAVTAMNDALQSAGYEWEYITGSDGLPVLQKKN